MNKQIANSRQLRKNMTIQEKKFWNIIKNRQFYGYRFRRQFPIRDYIVDFICREKKIIIEIDGGQHNQDKNIIYYNIRTNDLEQEGYKVIRFWNNEIDGNLSGVYEKLQKVFCITNEITPPQPSLSGDGVEIVNTFQNAEIGINKKVPSPDGEG